MTTHLFSFWMQTPRRRLGVPSAEPRQTAAAAGLAVVVDYSMVIDHDGLATSPYRLVVEFWVLAALLTTVIAYSACRRSVSVHPAAAAWRKLLSPSLCSPHSAVVVWWNPTVQLFSDG